MCNSLSIAMVSDFFHPNVGGVESHIYELSQCLILRGHKVIVITHQYPSVVCPDSKKTDYFTGVRFLPCGLKVYYLPLHAFYNQCIFPTVLSTLPIIREILLRERVQLVHGHSAFSTLGHEAMFHASCLGLHTVFTDHSLFGFADVSSVLTNKVLQISLANVDQVICVSHTSKENTVLRSYLEPRRVYVIPNAVEAELFTPQPETRDLSHVTVVVLSRLVYRKGIDFLEELIPSLCQQFPTLRFLVAGDGPKRLLLEEVREQHCLESRVILVGALPHERIRETLIQGDIFLNTSLTEAFCIAILEAVCCGLDVVSTAVGGVPEVLPANEAIHMVPPTVSALRQALVEAIERQLQWRNEIRTAVGSGDVSIQESPVMQSTVEKCRSRHEWVARTYNWHRVAERTEQVYWAAMEEKEASLKSRLRRILTCGPICGLVMVAIMMLHYCMFIYLQWSRPMKNIPSIEDALRNVTLREEEKPINSKQRKRP